MRIPFDPPPGLISNDTVYAMGGGWADGENLRFVEGRAQTIGGWQRALDDPLTGKCRNAITWTNNAGLSTIAFGTHDRLQVWSGGELADITPSDLLEGSEHSSGGAPGYGSGWYGMGPYSTPPSTHLLRTWSLDTWGETLVAAPRAGTVYQWSNDPAVEATAIANAPDTIRCMLVTPERQILAFGCNEEVSNDFNPLCIRGCDIEDLTDWTTSSANNAFEHILEGGGQIVTARMVGSYVAVWTDNNLHQGQFLGYPEQTYRFDRIDKECGILGPNAVAVHKGVAYWVGRDRQVWAWTPGMRPEVVSCPIWKDFSDNLHAAQSEKLIAVSNSRFSEIWFFYPDLRDGNENSRYIAISLAPGLPPTWFRGPLARTAACDAGVLSNPIQVGPDGTVYYHELGTSADGQDLTWRIRSAAQYLDEAERVLQVQRITPDFKDQSQPLSLTVHLRARPQDAVRTKGPFALGVGAAKKDIRFSAAIAEFEFAGTGHVRFGKPTFDAVLTGRR